MKRGLQVVGGVIVAVTVIGWLVLGANRGWTSTQTRVVEVDPITEIEGVTWKPEFRPGVEVLGAGVLLGVGAVVAGQLLGRRRSP